MSLFDKFVGVQCEWGMCHV